MSEERAGHTVGGRVPFSTTWRCKCNVVRSAVCDRCLKCDMERPPESYWPHGGGISERLFSLNWDEIRAVQEVRREAVKRLAGYEATPDRRAQLYELYERCIEVDAEIRRRSAEEDEL